MLVILRVEFACMQHGRRCVGATIVVSKRGEFRDSNAACTRNEEYIGCYRLLLLLLFFLPFFLTLTINTQPPLRLCSDSCELVATDTTEAAGLGVTSTSLPPPLAACRISKKLFRASRGVSENTELST